MQYRFSNDYGARLAVLDNGGLLSEGDPALPPI